MSEGYARPPGRPHDLSEPTYEQALASLRAATDVEVAITLQVFSRSYERVFGERCAAAEVAAERLLAGEVGKAP